MTEYIIKVDEDKKDIIGNCPLVEKPQELIRCKDCRNAIVYDGYMVVCTHIDSNGNDQHTAEWFCADGERNS